MTFAVVLDTCVLYPAHLRDTLLRLTEVVDPSAVDHLLAQMTIAFPDAEVTGHQALIDGLMCDPKDRHVLASAVRANAGAIVTFNTTDFPDHSVEPYSIEVIHPDTFLLDLLDLAPRNSGRRVVATGSCQSPSSENALTDARCT